MAITKERKSGFNPISIEDYPDISSNCLAFVLGQTKEVASNSTFYNLSDTLPIEDAFLNKCKEFGIKARNLNSIKDANSDEYVICIFSKMMHDKDETYREFHAIRRETDNKKWVHKVGWNNAPEIVTASALAVIESEFSSEPAIFALKAGE